MAELRSIGKNFQEKILHKQQEKCQKILTEIAEKLDLQEDQNLENFQINVENSFAKIIEGTERLFVDPDQLTNWRDYFRRMLLGIAFEQGFYDKIDSGDGLLRDNIVNCYYWFKLYSSIILDKPIKIKYDFILQNIREFRGSLSHGLLTSERKEDVSIIGFLVLFWYLLEDVLKTWHEILNLPDKTLNERDAKLNNITEKSGYFYDLFGFVSKLSEDIGYITSYPRGEEGKSTMFKLKHVKFFPLEGDIVKFSDKQDKDTHNVEYKTLTAIQVEKVFP